MAQSLNNFLALRRLVIRWRCRWLVWHANIKIDESSTLSLSAHVRAAQRGGVVIGPETLVAFKTYICSIDPRSGLDRPIRIGRRCFIGGGSMIAPGVTVGDESIVGAGAVVMEDVPPRSIVGGNPARILKRDIEVGPYGRLKDADANTRRLWRPG